MHRCTYGTVRHNMYVLLQQTHLTPTVLRPSFRFNLCGRGIEFDDMNMNVHQGPQVLGEFKNKHLNINYKKNTRSKEQ